MIKKFDKYLNEELNKEDYIATLSSVSLEDIVKDYFKYSDILFTIEEGTKIYLNRETFTRPKLDILKELQKYLKDTFDLNSKKDVGHKTRSIVLVVPEQILDRGVKLSESSDSDYTLDDDILDDEEQKSFREWVEDGNAVKIADDKWVEQTTQYKKKFTTKELQEFFKREFLLENNSIKEGIEYESLDTEQKEYLDELNDSDTEMFDMADYEFYADKIGVSLEELMGYLADKNLVKNSKGLNEHHLGYDVKEITEVRKGDLAYNLRDYTPSIVLKPDYTKGTVHIIELYKDVEKNVELLYNYLIQEGDFKQIEEICQYVHTDGMSISDKESAMESMKSVQEAASKFNDSQKHEFLNRYKDILKDAVIDAEIFAPIKEVVYNNETEDGSVYVYSSKIEESGAIRIVESFEKFTHINENKDYLRQIAKDIKKKYKDYKFSIRVSYNKISISILEAPIELRLNTSEGNEPVNNYYVREHYKDNPEAKEVLADIADMALSGQKEKSYDGDYGSIPNYYVDLEIGKWDKPFKVVKK